MQLNNLQNNDSEATQRQFLQDAENQPVAKLSSPVKRKTALLDISNQSPMKVKTEKVLPTDMDVEVKEINLESLSFEELLELYFTQKAASRVFSVFSRDNIKIITAIAKKILESGEDDDLITNQCDLFMQRTSQLSSSDKSLYPVSFIFADEDQHYSFEADLILCMFKSAEIRAIVRDSDWPLKELRFPMPSGMVKKEIKNAFRTVEKFLKTGEIPKSANLSCLFNCYLLSLFCPLLEEPEDDEDFCYMCVQRCSELSMEQRLEFLNHAEHLENDGNLKYLLNLLNNLKLGFAFIKEKNIDEKILHSFENPPELDDNDKVVCVVGMPMTSEAEYLIGQAGAGFVSESFYFINLESKIGSKRRGDSYDLRSAKRRKTSETERDDAVSCTPKFCISANVKEINLTYWAEPLTDDDFAYLAANPSLQYVNLPPLCVWSDHLKSSLQPGFDSFLRSSKMIRIPIGKKEDEAVEPEKYEQLVRIFQDRDLGSCELSVKFAEEESPLRNYSLLIQLFLKQLLLTDNISPILDMAVKIAPVYKVVPNEVLDELMRVLTEVCQRHPEVKKVKGLLPFVYRAMLLRGQRSQMEFYIQILDTLLHQEDENSHPTLVALKQIATAPLDLDEEHPFHERYGNSDFRRCAMTVCDQFDGYFRSFSSGEKFFKDFYKVFRAIIYSSGADEYADWLNHLGVNLKVRYFLLEQLAKPSEKEVVQKSVVLGLRLCTKILKKAQPPHIQDQCVAVLKNVGNSLKDFSTFSSDNELFCLLLIKHLFKGARKIDELQTLVSVCFNKVQKTLQTDENFAQLLIDFQRNNFSLLIASAIEVENYLTVPRLFETTIAALVKKKFRIHDTVFDHLISFTPNIDDSFIPTYLTFLEINYRSKSDFSKISHRRFLQAIYQNYLADHRQMLKWPVVTRLVCEMAFNSTDSLNEDEENQISELSIELMQRELCPAFNRLSSSFILSTRLLEYLGNSILNKNLGAISNQVLVALAPHFDSEEAAERKLTVFQQDLYVRLFISLSNIQEITSYDQFIRSHLDAFSAIAPTPQKPVHLRIVSQIATSIFFCANLSVSWDLSNRLLSYDLNSEQQQICYKIMKIFISTPFATQIDFVSEISLANQGFIQRFSQLLSSDKDPAHFPLLKSKLQSKDS